MASTYLFVGIGVPIPSRIDETLHEFTVQVAADAGRRVGFERHSLADGGTFTSDKPLASPYVDVWAADSS